jgi:hypothetical protein
MRLRRKRIRVNELRGIECEGNGGTAAFDDGRLGRMAGTQTLTGAV